MLSYWLSDIKPKWRQKHDWIAPYLWSSHAYSPSETGSRTLGTSSSFARTQLWSYLKSTAHKAIFRIFCSIIDAFCFYKPHHLGNTSLNLTSRCCKRQGWSHLLEAMISSSRILEDLRVCPLLWNPILKFNIWLSARRKLMEKSLHLRSGK